MLDTRCLMLDTPTKGLPLRSEMRSSSGIHLNDKDNLGGHHESAVALNEWLKQRTRSNRQEAGADDVPERPSAVR